MHPILLEIGPITLRSYGLFLALGFLGGIALMTLLNRKEGRSDDLAMDMSVWIMAGGIIGARLMYVAVQPESFLDNWLEIFMVWQGGLVYYGGLFGATLAGIWYLRRRKQPVWTVADCVAPGIAVGQAFGRIGCFFNGCCYGRVSHEHGVVFPVLMDNLPRFPTQLYETVLVSLLAVFLWRFKGKRSYKGQVFVLYLGIYGVFRFMLEFLRGDAERGELISQVLSPAQWTSIASVAIALWLHWSLSEKNNRGMG